MKRVIVNTAGHISDHRAKLTFAIMGACAVAAIFYAVNLYTLISHTVAMQKMESQAAVLGSAIGKLDAEYLRISSKITPDSLASYGLVPGHVSMYITRPAATANLVSLGNEL